ncbi:hypothetical protein AGABI1DRAFT_115712 [Agaricus bisporus var. burnettii JB137-S8]|uniref:Uncharacterized protein n=1 Tax=Agaricus bisporus var. burnettii (strain JB137-S8 / ATCC MYA-4627 / FGSC 10392) TaxID=597362 RepID=K5VQ99_AGABU|nr:uncharacterized protein AGABI1DRAFT_115712 [Agaricus bisporus var. burnettii JB137-S8]EKM76624.1 hypothetical protein AGABI1DRAFT_115712 [Agaricus bisporus var. burnettii JB137-S8]
MESKQSQPPHIIVHLELLQGRCDRGPLQAKEYSLSERHTFEFEPCQVMSPEDQGHRKCFQIAQLQLLQRGEL